MKIALITDTHWGVRNDSAVFHDSMKKFLDETFFPRLEAEGIENIIHLGDLVDRRKYINFVTAKRLREDFLQPIADKGFRMHIILGNHDTYFKNTNEVNALKELLENRYENVFLIEKPETIWLGTHILMLPWICDDNYKESIDAINTTKAQVVMGHLELNGFEMFKGSVSDHGMDHKIFDRFDVVCSGHYHHKSDTGNIHYLGAAGEYTWSDFDDPRGYHIFDTETREIEFVRNPCTIFAKVWYDDANKTVEEVVFDRDLSALKDKKLKVIVKSKTNPYWFDLFIDKIEKCGATDIQVVDDHLHLDEVADEDLVNEAEDTLTVCRKYISQLTMKSVDTKKLDRVITELYSEALQVE